PNLTNTTNVIFGAGNLVTGFPIGIDVGGGLAIITNNTLLANTTGLRITGGANNYAEDPSGFSSTTAHFNRIISTTTAIDNPNNLVRDLENNWWGCNDGPGNTGCGAVTGTGADFNPWMVLLATATPDTISPFGMSTLDADMTKNTDAVTPAGTRPTMPGRCRGAQGTSGPT